MVSDADPLAALTEAIARVRAAPQNQEQQRRLRTLVAQPTIREPAISMLAAEARTTLCDEPAASQVFLELLVSAYEALDRPMEAITALEQLVALAPSNVDYLLAYASRCANLGAWSRAAETFERAGSLANRDQACGALRAAAKLYREHGQPDRAVEAYRAIIARRPADHEAWRELEGLLVQLQRWVDVAAVHGELAKRAQNPVEKAGCLRAQARALEQAGDGDAAAGVLAIVTRYVADDISGVLDYADALARTGRGREAADLLAKRVALAVERRASADEIAGLRARQAAMLEDACGDRPAAAAVLEELLGECPDYVPALERLVWHASHDPDPFVQAQALERYAVAVKDVLTKAGAYVEAARRFRDARKMENAARAMRSAIDLIPDDRALNDELDDVLAALEVERATEEIGSGRVASAQRRLRAIVSTRPHDVDASVALADLLVADGDFDGARELLAEALRMARGAVPKTRLAVLAHKSALVAAAAGAEDEAHRLLHEAHLLDRNSLVITLALGVSCFARKLWRQAVLYLAPLADHPQARQHAAGVAEGLVLCGQAEVRALRRGNAIKHYEAAIRLDPASPTAWHELAELAMEQGDLGRAAECLEREAMGTANAYDRNRLFDALGNLALDVLHDPERAERYWRCVADGDAEVLCKLLAVQRRRGDDLAIAETCVRLAALDATPHKALLQEAADRFAAVGDFVRARAAAESLIAMYPVDADALDCATRVVLTACDAGVAAGWLHRALDTWRATGVHEPREAELWGRLGDAERSLDRKSEAKRAYERAIATAASADAPEALAARRALMELTPRSARTLESLEALVEADPSADEVVELARALMKANRTDEARAMFDLARALGVELAPEDKRFLADTEPRAMAYDEAYGCILDDQTRRDVIDDADEGVLGLLFDLLGEAMPLLAPDATRGLHNAGIVRATRLSVTTNAAAAILYPQISKALRGPATLLNASPELTSEVQLVLASPPAVVISADLAAIRGLQTSPVIESRLRFLFGRVVELSRPRRILAFASSSPVYRQLVDSVWLALGPRTDAAPDPQLVEPAKRLSALLPIALRRRISELIAEVPRRSIDEQAYLAACVRAADRSGLLACGSLATALELCEPSSTHVIRCAASRRYRRALRALRPRR